jgi:hypothetical protein
MKPMRDLRDRAIVAGETWQDIPTLLIDPDRILDYCIALSSGEWRERLA